MNSSASLFEYQLVDDVLVIIPQANLLEVRDIEIREAYNETYRMLTAPESNHMIIDFGRLSHFGSTFIGLIIRLAKKVRLDGGNAYLCCLSDDMHDMLKRLMLLENTKTDFFLTPFATREEAVAAVNG